MLSRPTMVRVTSDTRVQPGLIATYTRKHAHVRPLLSPSAGLLLIEAMHLTTPTVSDVAWGTAEGACTSGASMLPEWAAKACLQRGDTLWTMLQVEGRGASNPLPF